MANVIDFNCDLGESFGAWKLGMDEEIAREVTSVNVATGFHAGDPDWMARTVALAVQNGVAIGAQPGYPDLQGFGRRDLSMTPEQVANCVTYQAGALAAFTPGRRLQHVKPHGAMYNKAVRDEAQALAVVRAIRAFDPDAIHVVLAGSQWERVARANGVRVARECFADRAVTSEGTLVPRSEEGAVIHDEAQVIERSIRLIKEGRVRSVDGVDVEFPADTICLHGDTQGAVRLAGSLRYELGRAGIEIRSMGEFVPAAGE